MKTVDVAILGAGTAGLTARKEVAKVTDNYVVIDPGPLGTTCARVGCMPSKALIQIAHVFEQRHLFADYGIAGSDDLHLDIKTTLIKVRTLRDRFVGGVLADMERWQKGHFIQDKATFVEPNVILAGNQKIAAKKTIIATGSKPVIPEAFRVFAPQLLDTDRLFELPELPKRLAILGLGVVGIEMGQALARLGISVEGFDITRAVGGLTDPMVIDKAVDILGRDLPLHFEPANLSATQGTQISVKAGVFEDRFDGILLATGRRPALNRLELDKTGVVFDQKGVPVYDPHTLRIAGTNLYLAGDVNAKRPLMHEAADQGLIAGYNSVHAEDRAFGQRVRLAIVFTDPNIAHVGTSFQDLMATGQDFVTGEADFRGQGRAMIMAENRGLIRVYFARRDGRLLGAELFAPRAEHLAHLLAWCMAMHMTVTQMLTMPFYHPVVEEGLRIAFRDAAKKIDGPKNLHEVPAANF